MRIVAADAAERTLALPEAAALIEAIAMVIDFESLAFGDALLPGVDIDEVVGEFLPWAI